MTNKYTMGDLILKYKRQYYCLKPIESVVVSDTIYFNIRGFKHLIFKGKHRRPNSVIKSRLVLIPLIAPTIKNCEEITETRIRKEFIDGKKVQVIYHSLESRIGKNNARIRVVVRKVGNNGKFYFFSIMKY